MFAPCAIQSESEKRRTTLPKFSFKLFYFFFVCLLSDKVLRKIVILVNGDEDTPRIKQKIRSKFTRKFV